MQKPTEEEHFFFFKKIQDHFTKGIKNKFWENEIQLTAVKAAAWAPCFPTLFGHLCYIF